MTTTDLIKLLQDHEKGASGRSREISMYVKGENRYFVSKPKIVLGSTGDGCLGAEICLDVSGEMLDANIDEENSKKAITWKKVSDVCFYDYLALNIRLVITREPEDENETVWYNPDLGKSYKECDVAKRVYLNTQLGITEYYIREFLT